MYDTRQKQKKKSYFHWDSLDMKEIWIHLHLMLLITQDGFCSNGDESFVAHGTMHNVLFDSELCLWSVKLLFSKFLLILVFYLFLVCLFVCLFLAFCNLWNVSSCTAQTHVFWEKVVSFFVRFCARTTHPATFVQTGFSLVCLDKVYVMQDTYSTSLTVL